jgi:hypothetical protein
MSRSNNLPVSTLDPKIREGLERMRDEAREKQMFQPFPNWPDDRRAAPNDMLRSALFGVVQRGCRKMLDKHELPAPPGWRLYYTGRRLDQVDQDIWLEIMHRARTTTPGDTIRFTFRSVLHNLGHLKDGSTGYRWLKDRLEGMTLGGFSYESQNGSQVGATGSLLRSFRIDQTTGEAVIETNPHIRSLFESVTYLNFTDRLALDSQLAKWLHALIASHVQWMPTKVETLMLQSGASYARLRDFRADLRAALDDLKGRKLIRSWEIGTADLVCINKDGTPSQRRHLATYSLN